MENNGRRSCTGNSRHVNIRYFFVKDLVDRKRVRIIYCPTGKMLGDFFTKPTQGELFRFFRNIIMGYISAHDVIGVDSEMKERVEKWGKYKDKLISLIESNTDGEVPSQHYTDARTTNKQNKQNKENTSTDVPEVITYGDVNLNKKISVVRTYIRIYSCSKPT